LPAYPSLNDSTSSYTQGSNVSYPAHTLLVILFHTHTAKNFVKICSYPGTHLYSTVLSDTLQSAGFMAMATATDNEYFWQYISLVTKVWVYLQHKISFSAEPVVEF